jgi:hypothetical protein
MSARKSDMILVRDLFRLKFGHGRDALAAFKQAGDAAERAGFRSDSFRVLTDLVGRTHARARDDISGPFGI